MGEPSLQHHRDPLCRALMFGRRLLPQPGLRCRGQCIGASAMSPWPPCNQDEQIYFKRVC